MDFSCHSCGNDSNSSLVCRSCIPMLSAAQHRKVLIAWHRLVVERDGNQCVYCGHGADTDSGELCGNHKMTRRVAPDLIFDIDNGECVCMACNNKFSYSAPKEQKLALATKRKGMKQNLCKVHRMLLLANGKCLRC